MESIKEEYISYLPHDLISDIENDSLETRDENSLNFNEQEDFSLQNSNNNIFHCQSFPNLSFDWYNESFQKNNNVIPYVKSMDDVLQRNYFMNQNYINSSFSSHNYNNFKENQFKHFLLSNRKNLLKIIMSYQGSHYLQKISFNASSEEIDLFINILNSNIMNLMNNSYGNYLIQKIILKCNKEQRIKILNYIKFSFNDICKNNSGNHCIRSLIECINSDEEEKIIEQFICNHLLELSLGTNSNHVIQKLIEQMNKREYLINFLLNNFFILTLNLNGAAVAKKFISEIKDDKIKMSLISLIEKNYFKMCEDQYANYVIQYAIEIFGYSNCKNIIHLILNNILIFSNKKYASNVIDKIIIQIRENNPLEFFKLMKFLFTEKNFNTVNKNKFGQFVISNLIKLIPKEYKPIIKNQIINYTKDYNKYVRILNLLG
jgi:mRNA-binding protein PUF3